MFRVAMLAAAAAAGVAGPGHTSSESARAERPVRLTIEVNGDLLIHSPVWQRAAFLADGDGYDFAPLLRQIRPFVRGADLALCHVETPMTSAPPTGYPVFNTPRALARAIRQTGWDACSTASNHTLDRGQSGVNQTLQTLNREGLEHAGSAISARGARRITMLRAKGVKVAYLAYTAMTNGIALPHPWSVALADARRIRRDALRARRAGARAVIVNLHWGTEYQHAPDAAQLALVRELDRSKAITAIVGQHVHVVQPIRKESGRFVVYGEGNLLSNQTAACCPAATQDGLLALLHLRVGARRARVSRVNYVPTYVRHPDFTVVPAPRGSASWKRTVGVVGRGKHVWPIHKPLKPRAAAARSCDPVVNPYAGTRYEGVDLTGIRGEGIGCKKARRVARGSHHKALGITPPVSGVRRFAWHGWRVTGNLRGNSDRYVARKGQRTVRYRF